MTRLAARGRGRRKREDPENEEDSSCLVTMLRDKHYFRSAAFYKENKMASASLEEEDELNFGKLLVRTFSASAPPDSKREAQWKVERLNLLNIANLCIKNLIDSALKLGQVINDEYFEPFQQFFVVLESVFRHGLKSK